MYGVGPYLSAPGRIGQPPVGLMVPGLLCGLEADPELVPSGLSDALQRARRWFGGAAFQPCDDGLLALHAPRQLLLRKAGTGAHLQHRRRYLDVTIGLAELPVLHPAGVKAVE